MGTIGLLNRWIIVISTAKRLRPKARVAALGYPGNERALIINRNAVAPRNGVVISKPWIDLSKKLGRNRVAVDVQFPVYPG